MKISNITVENYKIFNGTHSFDFKGNLIFLVGENNTGKTTLFEAVSFLKSGLPKEKKITDIRNKFANEQAPVTCTIKFTGNIQEVIEDFSEAKYQPYVFVENGEQVLLAQRSSESRSIMQGGKTKELSIKTVTIWNQDTSQFENPSGIDTVLSTLFETQFVWADTDPTDISDFGSTKICGRLLAGAVGDFFDGGQWKKFTDIHQETFHGDGDSLGKRTKTVEQKIKAILEAQYGEADVRFNFSLPDASTFYKAGDIAVNDGVDTKLQEKGTGMQRAIALAMIQVYAQGLITHPSDPNKTKPLFFFIDEPEICLHPKAQKQLVEALQTISEVQQIFITSHSPYLLKTFDSNIHDLFVFKRENKNIEVTPSINMNLFDWSPSWGEINYKAYDVYTIEFHNELYGYLQERECCWKEQDMEKYLELKSIPKNKSWVRVKEGIPSPAMNVTLMTFIRNTIHHPENRNNLDFSDIELKESTENLISLF